MVSGNIGYLVKNYSVIPMIAVGIVSDNRYEEFSPDSDKLQKHLEQEVFPLIEETYRVNSFRIIIGHSWGGAFVGNCLFSKKHDLFDAYMGISPGLDAEDDIILTNAKRILKKGKPIGKYMYCSSGDIGYREEESLGAIRQLDSLLTVYPNAHVTWDYEALEGMDHWSCVLPSINNGLIQCSRNYFADQQQMEEFAQHPSLSIREQIAKFNAHKEHTFGFSFEPSLGYLRFVADDFREQGNHKAAKELYLLMMERGSKDVVCYFNLAQTYEKLEEEALAKESYQQTAKLLEEQKDSLKASFYQALKEAVEENLKKLGG